MSSAVFKHNIEEVEGRRRLNGGLTSLDWTEYNQAVSVPRLAVGCDAQFGCLPTKTGQRRRDFPIVYAFQRGWKSLQKCCCGSIHTSIFSNVAGLMWT